MILVTGAGGQVGTAFRRLLVHQALFLTRRELDLTDFEAVLLTLTRLKPELILNCAAFNAVDRAEDEPAVAYRANALAVGQLAVVSADLGCRFVTYSTDYVFDGSLSRPYLESDEPSPLSVYGRSKLAGEELAMGLHPDSLVVRTSWVTSSTHRNFVASALEKVGRGEHLRVVADQVGCPTIAEDLAAATWEAIQGRTVGLLHLANQGPTSRYALAQTVLRMAGLDPDKVKPCTTSEYPTRAMRPASSVLGSNRLGAQGIQPLPHWEESMPKVVAGLLEWL